MEPSKLVKYIVSRALKLGATDAVAKIYVGRERRIKFANNEVIVAEEREEASTSIFVAIRERRAMVSVDGIALRNIDESVKQAIQLAKMSQPSDVYAPLPRGPFKYDKSLLRAGKINGDADRLVDAVEAAINAALSEGARKTAGSLTYSSGKTWLRTSGGAYGVAEEASIELSIRAFASDDATGHFVSAAAREQDFDPEGAGRRAGELAKLAVNPIEGEPGTYEALLGPMTLASLVEEVGEAASAFYVDAGLSFLAEKIGDEVASDIFTLVDDPTTPETCGSWPFDDEGVPTRRNVIVERGVLKTYLHNSATAKKFNVETTANAGLIVPAPFNLIVDGPGEDLEKMVSDIDNGIHVTNNWYLRYQNYRTGDFSTIPRDALLRIRRGSIEGAVKGLRISDNILKVFKNMREMSRERYWILWWEVDTPTYAPYAVVDELNFTRPTS